MSHKQSTVEEYVSGGVTCPPPGSDHFDPASPDDLIRIIAGDARDTPEYSTQPLAQSEIAALQRKIARLDGELNAARREITNIHRMSARRQFLRASKRLVGAALERLTLRESKRALPRISIVTPVLNASAYIRETIESVLAQEYPDLEYIVVDGGSTDGTQEIIREYRPELTAFISESDNGMYDAVAKGFELATGDVLGYLNADDLLEPGGLHRLGAYFRRHRSVQVAYREDTVTADGWRFPNCAQPRVDMFHLLRGHILFQDGVYFRRSAYEAVGGVDRTLRMAGDYDLWLRLSQRFTLHRAPGHVSSFRIRPGQLSTDMNAYGVEQRRSRRNFRAKMGLFGYVVRMPRHLWNVTLNTIERLSRRRRFFYPLTYVQSLPSGQTPMTPEERPLACPLTGHVPDRLLFSTTDTRFGHSLINYLYHCRQSDVVMTWPPLSRDQLNDLYERYYSRPDATVIAPPPGVHSPYRGYRGRGLVARAARRVQLPEKLCRLLTLGERGYWGDVCCRELLKSVGNVFSATDDTIRMLDVGCFEGDLLDTMGQRTSWRTSGLEANSEAAACARSKGHEVWECFAEDAVATIPGDRQFDLIYLGQVIEHFNDPRLVLQRLTQLLAPGGMMVLSTPNINSKQVELFGPTWAHWHAPYHRVLFSPRSLNDLARQSGLRRHRMRTYANSYWTALSIKLNQLGVGGAVPHTWDPPPPVRRAAGNLAAWSTLLWNWRGQGDYIVASYRNR